MPAEYPAPYESSLPAPGHPHGVAAGATAAAV